MYSLLKQTILTLLKIWLTFGLPSLIFVVVVGWAISRCLSTTSHPIGGQGGSILLAHYSMITLKPAIFEKMAVVMYNQIPIYNSPSGVFEFSCIAISTD